MLSARRGLRNLCALTSIEALNVLFKSTDEASGLLCQMNLFHVFAMLKPPGTCHRTSQCYSSVVLKVSRLREVRCWQPSFRKIDILERYVAWLFLPQRPD